MVLHSLVGQPGRLQEGWRRLAEGPSPLTLLAACPAASGRQHPQLTKGRYRGLERSRPALRRSETGIAEAHLCPRCHSSGRGALGRSSQQTMPGGLEDDRQLGATTWLGHYRCLARALNVATQALFRLPGVCGRCAQTGLQEELQSAGKVGGHERLRRRRLSSKGGAESDACSGVNGEAEALTWGLPRLRLAARRAPLAAAGTLSVLSAGAGSDPLSRRTAEFQDVQQLPTWLVAT